MDLEKFRAYGKAQEVLGEMSRHAARWPRGHGWLRDQAMRSAGSVALNIAEGLGRPSGAERRRFLACAIGSAHEAAACAEAAWRMGLLPEVEYRRLWDACDHVTRMLGRYLSPLP
ncbi:MAG: four helix bundle protein [Planctomycetes bacterium]|nr:four helix bundle protein [Planctomycetota bacterium]